MPVPLHELGPKFETHKAFPRKTNMNFVQVIDDHTIKVHTWERGAGATLACGTGSCACAVGSFMNGFTGRSVDVQLTSVPFISNTMKKTATST